MDKMVIWDGTAQAYDDIVKLLKLPVLYTGVHEQLIIISNGYGDYVVDKGDVVRVEEGYVYVENGRTEGLQ